MSIPGCTRFSRGKKMKKEHKSNFPSQIPTTCHLMYGLYIFWAVDLEFLKLPVTVLIIPRGKFLFPGFFVIINRDF